MAFFRAEKRFSGESGVNQTFLRKKSEKAVHMLEFYQIFAAVTYGLTLSLFLYVTYRSRNVAWRSFGFLYFLYSFPFLVIKFRHTYFGKELNLSVPADLYLWLLILTITLIMLVLIDGALPKNSYSSFREWQRYGRKVSVWLIIISICAFFNDLLFWGPDLFFRGTAFRWSTASKHQNLLIISVDYSLLLMAGSYGLLVWSKSNKKNLGKNVSIILFFIAALIGLMQGHRYYVAILFLVWIFRPGLPLKGERQRYILSLLAIPVLLILAANVKTLPGFAIYYSFTHDPDFLTYAYRNFSWYPSEISAIASNTVIGFSKGFVQAPEFYKYLAKIIPFSSRWIDFSEFSSYYGQITEAGALSLKDGQGTAFSFYLENIDTNLFIAGLFFSLALLWRFFPNPIVSIIMINFSLNIIRNGAIVAVSGLKVSLLVVFILYALCWLFFKIRARKAL
jgi:uncharacterized membrane protein